MSEVARRRVASSTKTDSLFARAFFESATHERLLFAYVVGLFAGVLFGRGENRGEALAMAFADVMVVTAGIVAVRAPLIVNRLARNLVARGVVVFGIFGTFLQLHVLLPAARDRTVDRALLAFDRAMFGFEPAVAWDRFVTPATTEWFSFFYFGYFVLLLAHVVPILFFERRLRVLGEFALGMVTVYCVGQITYMIMPGFGPYQGMTFSHSLEGSTWWPLVQASVAAVDETKRTDIFPSLHTAGPTFLALFSFRHRALRPFRFTWPVVAFATTQIILATMFLRWHYLADVLAGIGLAVLASKVAATFTTELECRAAKGKGEVWRALL